MEKNLEITNVYFFNVLSCRHKILYLMVCDIFEMADKINVGILPEKC